MIERPCTTPRVPFYRKNGCHCLDCGWLPELHTEEGWRQHYTQRAESCAYFAQNAEKEVARYREAEALNRLKAEQFPASEEAPF